MDADARTALAQAEGSKLTARSTLFRPRGQSMMRNAVRELNIRWRLGQLVAVAIGAMVLVAALTLAEEREALSEERADMTRHMVESAHGAVSHFHALEKTAGLTRAQAQTAAIETLRQMRYGHGEYFWVTDDNLRMLLHPEQPQLEGTDLTHFTDLHNNRLFVDMRQAATQPEGGFIHYRWPRPNQGNAEAKIAYVKAFRPWGWVIGSGQYIDDIDRDFRDAAIRQMGLIGLAILLLGGLTLWISRRVEGALTRYASALADANTELRQAAAVYDNTMEGVVIADARRRITAVNAAFTKIFGYTEDEIRGRDPRVLRASGHDAETGENTARIIEQEGSWQGEVLNRRKSGDEFPAWTSINAIRDESGAVSQIVEVFSDISELKASEARLDKLAHHDPLTGLPNRLLLDARTAHALTRAARSKRKLAVLFIDLDRFKNVNDTLGHPAGDLLLQQVARRISNCVREQDTVSRLGGDEFTVLLEEIDDPDAASKVARKILGALSEKITLFGHDVFISGSVGISLYPDDGDDATTLFKNADSALYRAKEQGRDNYQFYTEDLTLHAQARLEVENDLRRALDAGQFEVFYQPQVNLHDGRIIGMEALLRWHHPHRGLVLPADFIALAEETGLIIPLGNWVMTTVCAQARRWLDAGLDMIPIGVNLSPRQFRQKNLVEKVSDILTEAGVPASCLELEITEGLAMYDVEESISVLHRLKALGVNIAIDDFGTGYSSLSYLKRFPIDRIKIDLSFVQNITTTPDDAAISKAIITMSHSLNRAVIAEGVETEAQRAFLASHHCDEMQGYHFSHPIPAQDMESMLKNPAAVSWAATAPEGDALLLVDDDPDVLKSLSRLFRQDGYRLLLAGNPDEAFDLLACNRVAVVVSDHFMPGMEGVEFLRRIKALYPDTVRILLTGAANQKTMADAINAGAVFKFVEKPWDDSALRECVAKAFRMVRK